ncbi:MAG: SIMPL domain-containing protein [Clostridia bacterium]|nr:SIMPL domain-containing protein [Clostridia bacterium]
MKKIIALLLAVMLVSFSFAALAEPRITVKGTGEVRVSADTAVISLGVNARDRDVLKAQQKVNESIAAIRQALIDHGVKEEDINTEFINIYAMYDYDNDREQLAAYNAGSTLAIRVTDMESVGALIDICFAAGANTLNGISFSASDTEEANNEAMKKAVADAVKKAEILAGSAGLKITGIELISEGGAVSYENSIGNVYAKGFEMPDAGEGAGTVVQAAKLIISASVTVTFTAE